MAFAGPGYLVAVGYMYPGNWAMALVGDSTYGYTLLSVALVPSLMAMLLQVLCARLGIIMGRDLARLCRERFPKIVAYLIWLFAPSRHHRHRPSRTDRHRHRLAATVRRAAVD